MGEKLWTRVHPKQGQTTFSAASLSRILANLAAEYGDLARVDVGRDADGPWVEVSRPPLRALLPTPDDDTTRTDPEETTDA